MKIKNASHVGRPRVDSPRVKVLYTLLPSIKAQAAKIAFANNMSASRYIENLILADAQKNKPVPMLAATEVK